LYNVNANFRFKIISHDHYVTILFKMVTGFKFVECELGKFGNNCAETCNCVNQPCGHITGVCPAGGCQRGYIRLNCSIGK
jgi:hypothetical protein